MRIIEVEYLGPPALGGVEALVEALYRKFTAAKHEVEIWCTDLASFAGPRHGAAICEVNGMKIRRFPAKRFRLWLFDPHHLHWEGLRKAFSEEAGRGSVFHINSFPSFQALAVLAVLKSGAAVVITPHHDVESLRRYWRLWRGKRNISTLLAAARKHPHLRLAVHTHLTKKFWLEEIGWPKGQIRIIPNGVYLSEFDEVSAAEIEAAARRWPQGNLRLLFVGRLAYSKGVDLLLRALAQIKNAALLAIGPDDGALADLKKLGQELSLESRVNFLSPPPRREVCAAFRACNVFILPSRFGENFGIAAIEAMAARKPVVVSDCGGPPTLVKQGENGIIFPVESVEGLVESLNYLTGSEALRRSLGEAGRNMVESAYTWERVADEYLSLFAAALNEGKSPADN
jgi:glycosyltransferase involved in cell wall biosynthesis